MLEETPAAELRQLIADLGERIIESDRRKAEFDKDIDRYREQVLHQSKPPFSGL
jgi:hypothetical protein